MLIITSKAKAYAKDNHDGMRLGKDFLEKLSATVETMIDVAAAKAKQDKRGTVKERDLFYQDPRAV
jgi:histone H3/H4